MTIVTLTTDFGTADEYTGAMKGVLLSRAPQARLVDISHQIPPQDVRRAAFVLHSIVPYFPADTVHLAVVDPGVGTTRRAIAIDTPGGKFVGPDNGLFTFVLVEADCWTAVELTNPDHRLAHVSDTFHGRDLFAPAAAHLAAGGEVKALGPVVTDPVVLPLPRLEISWKEMEGEVLHADRFGNLVTSIGRLQWQRDQLLLVPAFQHQSPPRARFAARKARVEIAGRTLEGIHHTYGATPAGQPAAIVGSSGMLEVGTPQGSAAKDLGVQEGEPVVVRFR